MLRSILRVAAVSLAVTTLAACSSGSAPSTSASSATPTPAAAGGTQLSGRADGTFTMGACPSTAKQGAMCADDTWASTEFTGLGQVTATFKVEFDQPSFLKTCAEVHKTGTIKVSDADTVTIKGDGFSCQDAGNIVAYTYEITGGTGKFAGASGTGVWLVPPPASMSGNGGVGPEILYGTIKV